MDIRSQLANMADDLQKKHGERMKDPKYYPMRVRPKHWWGWLSPSFWRMKRALEALYKDRYSEIEKEVSEKMTDEIMYGKIITQPNLTNYDQ